MNYYRITPIESLRPFICNYAYVNGDGVANYQQRVLPSGCVGLLFFRRSPVVYDDDRGVTCRRHAVIHGIYNKYIDVCPYNVEMIGVYFQPFGARLFFDFPITELKGTGVTPTDLGDKELMQLEEEIMTAPDIFKCVNLLDEFFLKRIARINHNEYSLKRVRHVLAQCLAPGELMTVQERQMQLVYHLVSSRVFLVISRASLPRVFCVFFASRKPFLLCKTKSEFSVIGKMMK